MRIFAGRGLGFLDCPAPADRHHAPMLHEQLETLAKGVVLLAALVVVLAWMGALG